MGPNQDNWLDLIVTILLTPFLAATALFWFIILTLPISVPVILLIRRLAGAE